MGFGDSAKTAFVGDGINDAPVLARSDVGVAMGGLGSDAAIETADVVLMTDSPMKLAESISIARKTRRIVWQNIILAFGVRLFFSPWEHWVLRPCGKRFSQMWVQHFWL